jgi:hypothetical protein
MLYKTTPSSLKYFPTTKYLVIAMATIKNAKLSISHQHAERIANVKVTCTVEFTAFELCQMKQCPEVKLFRLKCKLWSHDTTIPEIWFGGGNETLYSFKKVFYFPDPIPTSLENRTFEAKLGEGVLDEDGWEGGFVDEIYGKLYLFNLYTRNQVTKNTNVVEHRFD